MPMPSVTDLQTMYGSWNPQAYLTAQDNAGLERQFRESEYGRQQELTKQAGLETTFQEQNNPLKLEQGRLTNQNLGYTGQGLVQDNRKRTVEADIAEQTKQYKLNEAQRKDLLGASENDIAMGEAMARKLMMSLDPEERKQGEQLYGFTKYARDEKTKHAQAVELRKLQEEAANKRQAGSNATSIKVAEINQAGQDRRFQPRTSGGGTDFWTGYYKTRGAYRQWSALTGEIEKIRDENPEEAAKMQRMADALLPAAQNELANLKPGAVNLGEATNLPVNPLPQIAPKPRGNLSNLKLPEGAKKIGTSGGKDVYQLPDGRKVIVQ